MAAMTSKKANQKLFEAKVSSPENNSICYVYPLTYP